MPRPWLVHRDVTDFGRGAARPYGWVSRQGCELIDSSSYVNICHSPTIRRTRMPNVHLTEQMATYVQGQIKSGTYANVSEVVRSGIRMLMERDGARQFYALKTDLEEAVREAEAGGFEEFDPLSYEPDAGAR